MADNLVNQSLDRRREERAAEQLIQDNVTRLADLATTNMEIWQKYFRLRRPGCTLLGRCVQCRTELHRSDHLDDAVPSRRVTVRRTVEERAALLLLPSAALVHSQT